MGIGPSEWLIIILVLVVLFGAKKIPELAKGLGQGIKEFKKAANSANIDEDEKTDKPTSQN
jgi:sec-independent protein translocase protein TatA